MKKRTIILITIFSLAAVGGGGYGIYHLVKNGGDPVEVTVRGYELSLRKADAEMVEVQ